MAITRQEEYNAVVDELLARGNLKLQEIADYLDICRALLVQRIKGVVKIRNEELRAIYHLRDALAEEEWDDD